MKLWQVVLTFIVLYLIAGYIDDAIKACGACKMGAGW